MIYKSLDILPIKLFIEIHKFGNVRLLTDDDNVEIEILNDVWAKLDEDYKRLNPSKEASKILKISKEISAYQVKYKAIIIACEALRFDIEDELIAMLIGYGYKLSFDTYYDDIDRIERECGALLIKIEKLKEQLPSVEDAENASIDEVMASYSLILGFDFDYNTVSVTKFYALQKQVSLKIKAIEKRNGK